MRIAIVGANGQVGKEISSIFSAWGHNVTALVRNPYGAAYFHTHGIPYVIGNVAKSNTADSALENADIVVVAAVVRGEFKVAAKLNEEILAACVGKANTRACVVFFSSIRVFSRQIDHNLKWFEPLPSYDREKKISEAVFRRMCQARDIRGRLFRLGHVVGRHQAKTRKFAEALKGGSVLGVDPRRASNVVHTVTICDAILKASREEDAFISATVVNEPQWTWRMVFESLETSTQIQFRSPRCHGTGSGGKPILRRLLEMARPLRKWLKVMMPYLDKNTLAALYMESRRKEIAAEIEKLEGTPIVLSEFGYKQAPGPFLDGLDETSNLLRNTLVCSDRPRGYTCQTFLQPCQ